MATKCFVSSGGDSDRVDDRSRLEEFVMVVAHDLRGPVGRIVSMAERLLRRDAAEGSHLCASDREGLEMIARAASRVDRLITDLRAQALLCGLPQLEWLDLGDLVAGVLEDLTDKAREAKAVITVGALPKVFAPRTMLSQILQNLISNAVKFHGSDTPKVSVAAADLRDTWQVSVSDNGIGIDSADHARVFEMLQRLENAAAYRGDGIGLGICKRNVEQFGGRIWVESELGAGSTLHFTIPKPVDRPSPSVD